MSPRAAPSRKKRSTRASRQSGGPAKAGDLGHGSRLRRLGAPLGDARADAILLTNPSDIFYLTGFHGEDSWAIARPRSAVILSDRRFETELEGVGKPVKAHIRGAGERLSDAVVANLGRGETLAFQSDHLTVDARSVLAKKLGAKRLRATVDLVSKLREIKDESEVKAITKAIRVQEKALKELLPMIEAGVSETELAAELELMMRRGGASGSSFPVIMAAGANAALPHARPGRAKVKRNNVVLIDWGARAEHYCGDMTRTFALGRWPKRMGEVYDIVLESFHAGVEAVAPGVTGAEVDAASREVIESAGYGERFSHSLGHGLGIDVHERPRVSKVSEDVFEPGMVVTIEPGIYLPGVGGVRIENDVLVTEKGHRDLCRLPVDRGWSTLG